MSATRTPGTDSDSYPKVSVIIPVYNMAEYVVMAIDSALDDPYPNKEVVVLDDGSTDRTREVLDTYGSRIRSYRQQNGGVAAALNALVELAAGEYLRLLGADDSLYAGSLQAQVDALEDHPEVALVHGRADLIDQVGAVIGVRRPSTREGVLAPHDAFRWLLRKCDICASTVMVRREAVRLAGSFDSASVPGEDWALWLLIARASSIAFLNAPLAAYRIHDRSITSGYTVEAVERSHRHILESVFSGAAEEDGLRNIAEAHLDLTLARLSASLRHRRRALRYLWSALGRSARMALEPFTWGVLIDLLKSLLPASLLSVARRLRRQLATPLRRQTRAVPAVIQPSPGSRWK